MAVWSAAASAAGRTSAWSATAMRASHRSTAVGRASAWDAAAERASIWSAATGQASSKSATAVGVGGCPLCHPVLCGLPGEQLEVCVGTIVSTDGAASVAAQSVGLRCRCT
jgi:hypothetical protein